MRTSSSESNCIKRSLLRERASLMLYSRICNGANKQSYYLQESCVKRRECKCRVRSTRLTAVVSSMPISIMGRFALETSRSDLVDAPDWKVEFIADKRSVPR